MAKREKKADGGEVKAYDAAGSHVEEEAKEKKKGGRVKRKDGGKVEGSKPKMRMDRACRKDGGRVGSDKSPFTSAKTTTPAVGHKMDGPRDVGE